MQNTKSPYLMAFTIFGLSLSSLFTATVYSANPKPLQEQTLGSTSETSKQTTNPGTKLSRPTSLPDDDADLGTVKKAVASTSPKREQYKDWVLNCDGAHCIVHQYILDEQKRVISSVSLHKKQETILVTFTVPLMTRIDQGVDIDVIRYDDTSLYRKNLSYSYCTQIGCMMTYPLDQKIINAMEKGRKLSLTFAALDGRTVKSTHSLFGFSKALAEFKALN